MSSAINTEIPVNLLIFFLSSAINNEISANILYFFVQRKKTKISAMILLLYNCKNHENGSIYLYPIFYIFRYQNKFFIFIINYSILEIFIINCSFCKIWDRTKIMKRITNNLIWLHDEHGQTGTMCHIAYIVIW